jgi:A/G-specific adenine glycosylase
VTGEARELRRRLIAWYLRVRRELPWRATRDPYAVWISEIMLQQTRVETVIPYYQRFLEAFPDVHALAAAPEDAVLACWAGLGYYSRARQLIKAAREIVGSHGGRLPDTVEALEALPGIGRYTAGAIASIAYGLCAPLVDGNVARVLVRLFGSDHDIGLPRTRAWLWEIAGELCDPDDPSAWNQGLMELGSQICTPRGPRCGECPVAELCAARAQGRQGELPVKAGKRTPKKLDWVALALTRTRPGGPELLLARRVPRGLFGGLWELPCVERAPREPSAASAERVAREVLGLRRPVTAARRADATIAHTLTHRLLTLRAHRAEAPARAALARPGGWYDRFAWTATASLRRGGIALSSATVRLLDELGVP